MAVSKKKQDIRKNIWLIINFAFIMVVGLYIAIESEVVGIAYVANKAMVDPEAEQVAFNLTVDVIKDANNVMNKSIAISVGIYSLVQLLNYCVYLFKKKNILIGLLLLELVLGIVGFFINGDLTMFGFPFVSALIYLRVLKLEEV
ncbi:MAG: hypothetical protein IKP07_04040 [Bacilli bacterium]|nr:hypothetical protein [Bacilli bacterium]